MERSLADYGEGAVVVAVVAVGVVEVAINQVVVMIPVRDGWMATGRAVHVVGSAFLDGEARSAKIGVGGVDKKNVVVHMGAVNMVEVAGVEVISVSFVQDGDVTATRTMSVLVVGVDQVSFAGETGCCQETYNDD